MAGVLANWHADCSMAGMAIVAIATAAWFGLAALIAVGAVFQAIDNRR